MANSALNIVSGGGDGFYGLVLTNYGTVNWANTTIYGSGGANAQIYNYGVWNAQTDNTFMEATTEARHFLDNLVHLSKPPPPDHHAGRQRRVQQYRHRVTAKGALQIVAGTSKGGNFTTTNSGNVIFVSTPYNLPTPPRFTAVAFWSRVAIFPARLPEIWSGLAGQCLVL